MSTDLDRLREARKKHDDLRAEVIAWMEAEGRVGRLRHNCDAPAWNRYEEALEALNRVRFEVECAAPGASDKGELK